MSQRSTVKESWDAALAGDPESAFGGVLVCNGTIDKATAEAINEIFFEVLIAPAYDEDALQILRSKKNRIILRDKGQGTRDKEQGTRDKEQGTRGKEQGTRDKEQGTRDKSPTYRSLLNGVLIQVTDEGNYAEWKETGGRESSAGEKADLVFANLVCKHLKSNAIALVKNKQLIGKGCGQTSRIDSLRQAVEKANNSILI